MESDVYRFFEGAKKVALGGFGDDQIKGKWQKESYESKRNRGRYREGDGKEKEKERDEAISQLDIILGL